MKKSTVFAIALAAVFVTVGWLTIKSIGIVFLAAAAVMATLGFITARKG